jgi:hypothetical protein
VLKPLNTFAGDFVEDPSSSNPSSNGEGGDSTFDPFSDYSEFEEGSEEEADMNFFHNGRFFSVGFLGGYESFTQNLGVIYAPDFQYGLFLEYFFDLKLAMQLSYAISQHNLTIATGSSTQPNLTGNVSLNRIEFDLKYYLNTQNVTKGLAALNPYLLFGLDSYSRTQTINTAAATAQDSAFGATAGVGLEIPIMHNGAFFGVEATYHYVNWNGANTPITYTNGATSTSTGITPNGDAISLTGILGFSF